ncbi:hypothetical protein BTE77_02290 [Ensifer adhaerens]|nr:hypothetical protein BTE77_02290 [Ensifer adhaerens]
MRKTFPVGSIVCVGGKLYEVTRHDNDLTILTRNGRQHVTPRSAMQHMVTDFIIPNVKTAA